MKYEISFCAEFFIKNIINAQVKFSIHRSFVFLHPCIHLFLSLYRSHVENVHQCSKLMLLCLKTPSCVRNSTLLSDLFMRRYLKEQRKAFLTFDESFRNYAVHSLH